MIADGLCKACRTQNGNNKIENSSKLRVLDDMEVIRMEKETDYCKGVELLETRDKVKMQQGASLIMRSAKSGNAVAMTMLGMMYTEGLGVEKDWNKAFCWHKRSAEYGYTMGMTNYANCYVNGIGTEKDFSQAITILEQAEKFGDEFATFQLGKFHVLGVGYPKNVELGMNMVLDACERGSFEAIQYIACRDEEKGLTGCKACQKIVKKEFKAFFGFIKKRATIEDIYVPQEFFNNVVAEKRAGRFVFASRLYVSQVGMYSALSCNVAVAWLKVLAACGDVKDAMELGGYMLGAYDKAQVRNTEAWWLLISNVETLSDLIQKRAWQELADKLTDMGGGFNTVEVSDIDVYNEQH